MNVKIIIDIQTRQIKDYIEAAIKRTLSTYEITTYHDIQQPMIIFKEVSHLEELKVYKHKQHPEHSIIFIMKNPELAFDALDQYPLCFIREKSLEADVEKAFSLILNIYHQIEKMMTFKMGYSYIQLKCSQIMYIESLGHYLIVHTQSGTYKVRQKLSSIQKELPQSFQQIHKSYIVNKSYVLQRNSKEVVLKDQTVLPIGRSYKEAK